MRKRLPALLLILLLAIGVGTATYYLFFHRTDNTMRVRGISNGDYTEYSQSRLFIHSSGTFEIELIRDDETIFAAIGTYTKTRSKYTFTFIQPLLAEQTYDIVRGRIHFEFGGVLYHFGR